MIKTFNYIVQIWLSQSYEPQRHGLQNIIVKIPAFRSQWNLHCLSIERFFMPNINHWPYGDSLEIQPLGTRWADGEICVDLCKCDFVWSCVGNYSADANPTRYCAYANIRLRLGLTSRKEKLNRQKRVKAIVEFTDNYIFGLLGSRGSISAYKEMKSVLPPI